MEVNSNIDPAVILSPFLQLLEAQQRVHSALDENDCPEWMLKVIYRLQRSFAPSLSPKLLKAHPVAFEGYVAAALFTLSKVLAELVKEALGNDATLEEFIRSECERLQEHNAIEMADVNATIAKAALLPGDESILFFVAFGEGLKKETAVYSLLRMGDNQTVKFCFFLLFQSHNIRAGCFSSISELAEFFFAAQKVCGDLHYEENPNAKAAALSQFRRICSADGVRLRKRGRPQKPASAKKGADSAKTPTKKRSQKKPLSSGK